MHAIPQATGDSRPLTDSAELTDAELEAVAAGKLPTRDMEGRSGWFVPLPEKLRRN
jgi:hypothetical protein